MMSPSGEDFFPFNAPQDELHVAHVDAAAGSPAAPGGSQLNDVLERSSCV